MTEPVSVFWFRRDLRLHDNAGLYYALRSGNPVLPVFIFDTNILDDLEDKKDRRVCFIYDTLREINDSLLDKDKLLYVTHNTPIQSFQKILAQYSVAAVYTNEDYEPYARKRDEEIGNYLAERGIPFRTYKDQVIFSKDEVLKDNKTPYTVYTPYAKKWKQKLDPFFIKSYPTEKYFRNFLKGVKHRFPTLESLGFERTEYEVAPAALDPGIAKDYHKTRDIPSVDGTTRLSPHLRFGTVSIRELVREANELNKKLVDELIWREFHASILWHYPDIVTAAFRPAYDKIKWRYNEKEFQAWCGGTTGYPIVDAGMRQMNETGWMHNRVRMITASFLCKHLLIDWRWGEAYFAVKLLDYDLSQNVGNWQWVAGSGVDAAPYFRVFNPWLQQQKFDKDGTYIRQWIPELDTDDYPKPIVDHEFARKRCLDAYKTALGK